jgi:hypothetical protein
VFQVTLKASHGVLLATRGDRAALDVDEPDALPDALDELKTDGAAWQRSRSRTSEHVPPPPRRTACTES